MEIPKFYVSFTLITISLIIADGRQINSVFLSYREIGCENKQRWLYLNETPCSSSRVTTDSDGLLRKVTEGLTEARTLLTVLLPN